MLRVEFARGACDVRAQWWRRWASEEYVLGVLLEELGPRAARRRDDDARPSHQTLFGAVRRVAQRLGGTDEVRATYFPHVASSPLDGGRSRMLTAVLLAAVPLVLEELGAALWPAAGDAGAFLRFCESLPLGGSAPNEQLAMQMRAFARVLAPADDRPVVEVGHLSRDVALAIVGTALERRQYALVIRCTTRDPSIPLLDSALDAIPGRPLQIVVDCEN